MALCRISGNAASNKNIHGTVSEQLKKNFAKSRWKVSKIPLEHDASDHVLCFSLCVYVIVAPHRQITAGAGSTQGMSPCCLMVAASLPRDDGHTPDAEARAEQQLNQQPSTSAIAVSPTGTAAATATATRFDRPLRRSEPEPPELLKHHFREPAAPDSLRLGSIRRRHRRHLIVLTQTQAAATVSPVSNGGSTTTGSGSSSAASSPTGHQSQQQQQRQRWRRTRPRITTMTTKLWASLLALLRLDLTHLRRRQWKQEKG